ncbi:MAG: hypothetical protein AAF738_02380 [Bacteroidota bacterium]
MFLSKNVLLLLRTLSLYALPQYDLAHSCESICSLDGQIVQISGYMLPLAGTGMQIVLSRFPFIGCYFCGNAEPETVIELWLKPEFMRRYKMDARLTFKGKLRLNTTAFWRLSYILVDAEEVPQ